MADDTEDDYDDYHLSWVSIGDVKGVPFPVLIDRVEDDRLQDPVLGYQVTMPHQCDAWAISGGNTSREAVSVDQAIEDLQTLSASIQRAIDVLRTERRGQALDRQGNLRWVATLPSGSRVRSATGKDFHVLRHDTGDPERIFVVYLLDPSGATRTSWGVTEQGSSPLPEKHLPFTLVSTPKGVA